MTEKQKQTLQTAAAEVFTSELMETKSFTITDMPAADTLIVVATLMDVVSNVPPEPMGRNRIYLSRVGEATLALAIHDSQSGEVLLRAMDRRAADPSVPTESSPITNLREFKMEIRRWAAMLRNGLDHFHNM